MIINALNGVFLLNIYILQVIIKKDLERLTNYMETKGFLVMKIRKKSIYVSNKYKGVFYKQISSTCWL